MPDHILAIDQGTTSSRAILFDATQNIVAIAQHEFPQHFPASGWVEHDSNDIWTSVLTVMRDCLAKAEIDASRIAGIGIANQRETVVIWDRDTGEPVYPAIVWQDRRTAETCANLRADGAERHVTQTTGLLLDPYFSATKIAWLLDNVAGLRARAVAGRIAFGTIDSFLIWRLTGGRQHLTDATNAARTMLFNIEANDWDDTLLHLFNVPRQILPQVRDCDGDFGQVQRQWLGAEIPILGVAGDQQAAMIGNACFEPGMMKSTYGTGCFALLNTGTERVMSRNRLLSTIGYRLNGQTTYALEGSIFMAGATVQWLRDGLQLIDSAEQSGDLAAQSDMEAPIYLVPAFVGLGAPHWDSDARAAIYGMTRATTRSDIVRSALDAVCFQTSDLLRAMHSDWSGSNTSSTVLRVDGGMARSDWTMTRLADVIGAPVDRPVSLETTALGVAWLAGHSAGIWPDQPGFAEGWRKDRRFNPKMSDAERKQLLAGWADALRRTASVPTAASMSEDV